MDARLISEDFLQQLAQDVGWETMPTLIQAFEKGAKEHILALKAAVPNTDAGLEKMSYHGHALKGMAQSLGLPALGSLGMYLEKGSKKLQKDPTINSAQYWGYAAEILAIIDNLLITSLQALRTWLDSAQ